MGEAADVGLGGSGSAHGNLPKMVSLNWSPSWGEYRLSPMDSVPGRGSSVSKYPGSEENLVLKTSTLPFPDLNVSLRLPQPSLGGGMENWGNSQFLQPQVATDGTHKQEP